jgi:tight adherence protein B
MMSALLGVAAGTGFFLIWWSFWESPKRAVPKQRASRLANLLAGAGVEKVSAGGLLGTCIGLGLFVALVFFAATRSWPISCCFGLFGAWLPITVLRWRAKRRSALLRTLWPDVVDHLRSAIRAGLPLPEALIQLGDKGPEELRHVFRDFAISVPTTGRAVNSKHRSTSSSTGSLTRLQTGSSKPSA